ncbi:hypothetical protein L21SP5_00264 [Salinivirga cyanobacteriivorans]|uniref:Secretion system C-terminal sorting domain-containing protein n=1 Tax=Salinivirga cyanobacteriivorans TaxID=1307839 RepID=A0A0S2HV50_9BACT|nr:T9SS type A sorting domain-containing protein [Salinivirga cyanobacteriivorans]ALO13944.1 hypothetical protein L21SP5_00264 [Salinivirga cyanobacteriivorans]
MKKIYLILVLLTILNTVSGQKNRNLVVNKLSDNITITKNFVVRLEIKDLETYFDSHHFEFNNTTEFSGDGNGPEEFIIQTDNSFSLDFRYINNQSTCNHLGNIDKVYSPNSTQRQNLYTNKPYCDSLYILYKTSPPRVESFNIKDHNNDINNKVTEGESIYLNFTTKQVMSGLHYKIEKNSGNGWEHVTNYAGNRYTYVVDNYSDVSSDKKTIQFRAKTRVSDEPYIGESNHWEYETVTVYPGVHNLDEIPDEVVFCEDGVRTLNIGPLETVWDVIDSVQIIITEPGGTIFTNKKTLSNFSDSVNVNLDTVGDYLFKFQTFVDDEPLGFQQKTITVTTRSNPANALNDSYLVQSVPGTGNVNAVLDNQVESTYDAWVDGGGSAAVPANYNVEIQYADDNPGCQSNKDVEFQTRYPEFNFGLTYHEGDTYNDIPEITVNRSRVQVTYDGSFNFSEIGIEWRLNGGEWHNADELVSFDAYVPDMVNSVNIDVKLSHPEARDSYTKSANIFIPAYSGINFELEVTKSVTGCDEAGNGSIRVYDFYNITHRVPVKVFHDDKLIAQQLTHRGKDNAPALEPLVFNNMPAGELNLKCSYNGYIDKYITMPADPENLNTNKIKTWINNVSGCTYSTNGSIDVDIINVSDAFSYSISLDENTWHSGTSHEFNILPKGRYTIYARNDSIDVCKTNVKRSVAAPPPLKVEVSATTKPDCPGSNTGTIQLSIPDGNGHNPGDKDNIKGSEYIYHLDAVFSGQTYKSNPTPDEQYTFIKLPAEKYMYYVENQDGCFSDTTFFELEDPEKLRVVNTDSTNVECHGGKTGQYSFEIQGPYSDLVFHLNGLPRNFNSIDTIFQLRAGSYVLTIENEKGCSIDHRFSITEPDPLFLSFDYQEHNGFGIRCHGQSTSIMTIASGGTPGYTIHYDENNYTTDSISQNLTAGTHHYTVTDANNCVLEDSLILEQPDSLKLDILNTINPTCSGSEDGSIEVLGSGGVPGYKLFVDTDSISFDDTYTISNLEASIYPLALKDANGCRFPADGSYEIVQLKNPNPILLEISQKNEPTCYGYADGFIAYSASHDTLTEKMLTIYQDSLNGTVLQTDSFHDETLNNSLNDIPAGDYVIEVVETATGCNTSTAITVDQPDELTYTLNHTDITCFGDTDGIISLNVEGGTPSYSAWYNGAGQDTIAFSETTADFSSLAPGHYTVSLTDINNCPATAIHGDSVHIGSPEMALDLNLQFTQPTCHGDVDGTLTALASGGWTMYAFSMDSANWANHDSTHTFNALQAGMHPVFLRDTQNCVVLDSIEVTEPDSLLANDIIVTDANCPGSADGSFEVVPTGGNGIYSLVYQSDTMPGMIVDSLSEGAYAYHLEDQKGCVFMDSVQVNDPPDFAHQFTLSDHNGYAIRCNGLTDSVLIEISGGSPGYTLNFSGDGDVQPIDVHNFMISDVGAGTYQTELTDDHGCRYEAEVTLNEPDTLQIVNEDILEPSCHNYSNGQYTGLITGGIDWNAADQYSLTLHGDSILYQDVENDFQFQELSAGNYELVVSDPNNCQVSRSHSIAQPEPITLAFSTTPVVCKGGASGAANVNPAGGTPSYTYQWFDTLSQQVGTTKEIINLNAGIYKLEVTDEHGCAPHDSVLNQVTVQEPELVLALDTVEMTPVRCFGETNGAVALFASGGWANYEYAGEDLLWTELTGFTDLEAGNHRFYVRDSLNCIDSTVLLVPQPDSMQITNIGITQPLCNGGNDGSVEVEITGGNGGYLFNLETGNTSSGYFDSISSGNYFLQVADNKGCSASDSVWVDEPSAISHEVLTLVRPTCTQNNGSVEVAASGGTGSIAIDWTNDSVPPQFAIDSLFAGIYAFTLTDENLCTYTAQVTLSDIGGPEVSMQNITIPSCNYTEDGTLSVAITGDAPPFVANWYDENNQVINGFDTIDNLPGGTYTIAVSDTNNCQYNTSYELIPPEPVQSQVFSSDVICYGEASGNLAVEIMGGTAPYNLSWRADGEAWQSAQQNDTILLPTGSYHVKVFDAHNCHDETTDSTGVLPPININQPVAPLSAMAAPTPVKCYGNADGMASLNALGGWDAGEYLFALKNTPFTTQRKYTDLPAGTYWAMAKDIVGCVDSIEIEVGQPEPLEGAVADFSNLQCKNDSSGWVQLAAGGGTAPYYFSINQPNNFAQQTFYDQLTAGEISIFTRDKNNCEDSAAFTLTEPDSLKFNIFEALPSYCHMENGTLNISMEGGTAPYLLPDSAITFEDTLQLNSLAIGQHTVQIIDEHNCFIEKAVELEYVPGTDVELTDIVNPLCYGGQTGSISLAPSQGSPPYEVTLNGESGYGMEIQSLAAGSYTVYVADKHNCVDTVEVELIQPDSLFLNKVNVSDPVCFNDSTGYIQTQPIGGTAPFHIYWSNGESGDALELLSAGAYSYQLVDAHNCADTGRVILQNPDPLVTVLPDTLHLCANQTKTLDAVYNDHTYLWFKNNNMVGQERELNIESPGLYSLELYSPEGCFAHDSTEVIAYSYEADATLLMPTSAQVHDTLIMIDISWPMPDSLNWLVPSSFNLLEEYDYEIHTQTTQEGGYMAGLITYTGNCIAEHYKSVTVEGFNNGNGGMKNQQGVFRSVTVSPNPASEDALLLIDLFDPYNTKVELIDNQGEVVIYKEFGKAETHQWALKLKSLERGMYFLRIRAKDEYRFVKLIVI